MCPIWPNPLPNYVPKGTSRRLPAFLSFLPQSLPDHCPSPSFDAIQQEIANILDIPDEELTDEQRLAVEDYLNELDETAPGNSHCRALYFCE